MAINVIILTNTYQQKILDNAKLRGCPSRIDHHDVVEFPAVPAEPEAVIDVLLELEPALEPALQLLCPALVLVLQHLAVVDRSLPHRLERRPGTLLLAAEAVGEALEAGEGLGLPVPQLLLPLLVLLPHGLDRRAHVVEGLVPLHLLGGLSEEQFHRPSGPEDSLAKALQLGVPPR